MCPPRLSPVPALGDVPKPSKIINVVRVIIFCTSTFLIVQATVWTAGRPLPSLISDPIFSEETRTTVLLQSPLPYYSLYLVST